MNDQEKKKYILKHWGVSDGKKISEMLHRYWAKPKQEEIELKTPESMARDIFGIK